MHFPFAGKTTYCLAHKPQERLFKIKKQNKTKTETKTHWEKSSGCCVNCNRIFHRYLYFRIMEKLGKLQRSPGLDYAGAVTSEESHRENC